MARIGLIGLIGPILLIAFLIFPSASSSQAGYDLVILNGRVIDPE